MKRLDGEEHSIGHGFFHTMVVMGSALALGCGGESQSTPGTPEGTAGMGTDGAGGGPSNGGMAGGAGSPFAGSGPLLGFAGNPAIGGSPAIGGNPGTSGTGGATPLPDCMATQWTCSANYQCENFELQAGADCTCDATRPKSAADCATDESFVCMGGVKYDASGNAVQAPVPYECQCIPQQTDCESACRVAQFGVYVRCISSTSADPSEPILCGCAPIVLK